MESMIYLMICVSILIFEGLFEDLSSTTKKWSNTIVFALQFIDKIVTLFYIGSFSINLK
jgi:hypothetical protein